MLTVLDLFSGIGGFSLGLERSGGFRTVAFCEIETYARRVLARHWPGVPCYSDVRELTADRLEADGIGRVDVICGGFPCQDISQAGRGAGLGGERSGLWQEMRRLVGEVRPRLVIIENVAMLRSRGLDSVLRELDALGYAVQWHCIPAAAVGARHRRDRVWIVANLPNADGQHVRDGEQRLSWGRASGAWRRLSTEPGNGGKALAYAAGARSLSATHGGACSGAAGAGARVRVSERLCGDVSNADGEGLAERLQGQLGAALAAARGANRWPAQPAMGRAADGVPGGLDGAAGPYPVEPWEVGTARTVGPGDLTRAGRLRCLGNAVVPQIPELIGRAILASIAPELAAAA